MTWTHRWRKRHRHDLCTFALRPGTGGAAARGHLGCGLPAQPRALRRRLPRLSPLPRRVRHVEPGRQARLPGARAGRAAHLHPRAQRVLPRPVERRRPRRACGPLRTSHACRWSPRRTCGRTSTGCVTIAAKGAIEATHRGHHGQVARHPAHRARQPAQDGHARPLQGQARVRAPQDAPGDLQRQAHRAARTPRPTASGATTPPASR